MGLREVILQNQKVVAALAFVVIAASAVFILRGGKNKVTRPDAVYFYDLGSGELFAVDTTAQPPIDASSGPDQGVRAFVFSCGECTEAERRIGYLTTYSERARAAMATLSGMPQDGPEPVDLLSAVHNGELVAAPPEHGNEPQWVPALDPSGAAIVQSARGMCDPAAATPCFPG